MRELHHIGIPTTEKKPNETYMADAKLYVSDADASPNKVEWLRFEEGSPMPELLRTSTHIAYTVPSLEEAIAGRELLLPPFSPAEGMTVAFVVEEGLPIELIELNS